MPKRTVCDTVRNLNRYQHFYHLAFDSAGITFDFDKVVFPIFSVSRNLGHLEVSAGKTLIAVIVGAAAVVTVVLMVTTTGFRLQDEVTVIRVGVLPDEDAAELDRRYAPFLQHISRQTGLDLRLVVPDSYRDLLARFGRQELELAYFGGLTFVNAQIDHDARPLVMRDVDARFTTYFVVKGDGPLSDCVNLMCADLAGKVITFGSRLSTSGHLMPRHFLATEKAIVPETYFGDVRYSGAHDKTIYDTRDGNTDLGAVNSEIFRTMRRDGRLTQGALQVVWETPPYADYVWAVSDRLSEELVTRLRDAYLMLEYGNPEHREILSRMGARGFLPAGTTDFEPLRQVTDSLGLLAQQ